MRWVRAVFLPLSLMTLVSAALVVPLPLIVERPGSTLSLGACVDVATAKSDLAGDFLLTTINVAPATAVDAAVGAAQRDALVVGRGSLVPPGVDTETYFDQQRQEFTSTADIAAVVALQAAGHEVKLLGDGVQVVRVLPRTPAADVLRVGDVIVAVDGRKVDTETQLREAIAAGVIGEPLRLTVRRGGEEITVGVAPEEIQGLPAIGIHPQTVRPRVRLPMDVKVATGPIGGPSAGLMIALTIYDKVLGDVDVAAGRVVAGTGSITPDGRVGPIGGVGLKVLAADRQGADVFLAPAANFREAQAALPAGSSMRVERVETFDDARRLLAEHAGEVSRAGGGGGGECPYPPPA